MNTCLFPVQVETLRGEVDVEGADEADRSEEPRLRLQHLPPAEPEGRRQLRGGGERRDPLTLPEWNS